MSFRFLEGHIEEDGVASATMSVPSCHSLGCTYVCVYKLVDRCENVLVARDVFEAIWTVFLNPYGVRI